MGGDPLLAVGHIPGGLFVVTAVEEGGAKHGYLASWVQQASFDPPLVSLAIKEGRPGRGHIMGGGTFAVNVVGGHEGGYLKHFWKGYGDGDSPFDEVAHTVTDDGALVLKEAKSAMVCRLESVARPGDHEIVFARVLSSLVLEDDSRPKVHIRRSGAEY